MTDTITIPLPRGYSTVVDIDDADLDEYSWYPRMSTGRGNPHVQGDCILDGRRQVRQLHRVILARMLGRPLEAFELTDHIDMNPLNNRRSNLRLTNSIGNSANTPLRRDNKTGFKGVSLTPNKDPMSRFSAQCGGKFLGTFPTAEFAFAAYCNAAIELYGEFANAARKESS